MNLADREPVNSYEQALWWLISLWSRNGVTRLSGDPLSPESQLVCDMFWVTETTFRRDILKRQVQTFPEPPPARRSVLPYGSRFGGRG